jgi:hypothetical protein
MALGGCLISSPGNLGLQVWISVLYCVGVFNAPQEQKPGSINQNEVNSSEGTKENSS